MISRAWLTVWLLWPVACLNYLDRMMLVTMRESIVGAIPMSDAQFGLLTSAFLWVYGILSPFAGYLADRFNRGHIIIISLFIWSLVTWVTGYAQSFEQLLMARMLMGISEACYIPAALALIVDYHRGDTRSLATGIHATGFLIGAGLGGLGGWIAERHGYSLAFEVFGCIGLIYAVVLTLSLKEAPREGGAEGVFFREAMASLLSNRIFRVLAMFWALLGVSSWLLVAWLPTFFGERFNLSQGVSGISATAWLQGGLLIGMLLGGAISDRVSRRNELRRILVPLVGIVIASLGVSITANAQWFPMAIFGLLIYGLTRASADANMMPILCLVIDSRYRATGFGILNLVACLVGGLSVYMGGWLRDEKVNLGFLFQVSAVILAACSGLLWLTYIWVSKNMEGQSLIRSEADGSSQARL